MLQHRNRILRLATSLSSRQAAFLFALTGVVVQAFHTYYITNELSSLSGFWRVLQALLMAGFISCALLYFTLKSSDEDTKAAKRYRKTVWWFAIIETFINLYYWGNHLLIQPWPKPDYGSFLIAVPFSILIPFTLKVYAGEVRTDDYSDVEDDKPKDGFHSLEEVLDTFHIPRGEDEIPQPISPVVDQEEPYQEHEYTPESEESMHDDFDDLEALAQLHQEALAREAESLQRSPLDDYEDEIPFVCSGIDDGYHEDSMIADSVETEQPGDEPADEIPDEEISDEADIPESETPVETETPAETETVAETETSTEETKPELDIPKLAVEDPAPEIPSLGKEALGVFSNGGISTAPAYVAPKTPQPVVNPEESLFNYGK